MLTDFFDTVGTVVCVGAEARLLDEHGNLPGVERVLLVDSLGSVAGGMASSSSNTSYIESMAGVGEGARTGLNPEVERVLLSRRRSDGLRQRVRQIDEQKVGRRVGEGAGMSSRPDDAHVIGIGGAPAAQTEGLEAAVAHEIRIWVRHDVFDQLRGQLGDVLDELLRLDTPQQLGRMDLHQV